MAWWCAAAIILAAAGLASAQEDYWSGLCTRCPASLYSDDHCLDGGTLVGQRGCGFFNLNCEGRCRPPRAPTYYWDGECTPCPALFYTHCSRGGRLVGERACGFLNLFCEGRCMLPPRAPDPADWIIVGGGASGCAAAAALADAGESVLVLERGQSDLNEDMFKTQKATTWPAVVNTGATQKIRWEGGAWGAVANVLGGGTAVNAGLFIEEEPGFLTEAFGRDFDLQGFYASSRYLAANLSTPLQPSEFGRDLAAALHAVNLGGVDPQPAVRMSDGAWVAYSTLNTSASGWPRRGAAALLHDRAHLPNLRVVTSYQVLQVTIEGGRATGVVAGLGGGGNQSIAARKGVILAAGAIFTPQLLQLSGVGDAALLRRLGIAPRVKNSAVGRNFVDRNALPLAVWTQSMEPLFVGYAMAADLRRGLTIESEGWGQVIGEFALTSLALSPPVLRTPELRDTLKVLWDLGIRAILDRMMVLVALQHNTSSRGSVEAVSTDPTVAPRVDANFFGDTRDLDAQMTAMRALLDIVRTEQVQKYAQPRAFVPEDIPVPAFLNCITHTANSNTKAIVLPCLPPAGSADSRWFEFFRGTVISSYHYFGTAAFGTVVEGADFHIRGVDNLHVVDASVFPRPTRVNPQATIMAMGHHIGLRIAAAQRRLDGPRQPADVLV